MTLIQYLYLYLLIVPVFILCDLLWLGVVARGFYQSQLGHLLGEVRWMPAIIFYGIFILGMLVFAVAPGLAKGSFFTAVALGAFFGFVAYATYDLTNLATIRDWPIMVTIVDMVWGAVLGGAVASAGYLIGRALFF